VSLSLLFFVIFRYRFLFFNLTFTWHDGGAHLLAAPGQGERDQRAVEQRLSQVRIQVRHGRRECRDVVRQPMVGIFYPAVHVAHPIVSLVLEIQAVSVVYKPGSV